MRKVATNARGAASTRRQAAAPAAVALHKVWLLGELGEDLVTVRDDDEGLAGAIAELQVLNDALNALGSAKLEPVLAQLERCSNALGARSDAIEELIGEIAEMIDPDDEHARPADLFDEVRERLRRHGEKSAEEDGKG